MKNSQFDHQKYFNDLNPKDFISIEDLDLTINENDKSSDKEIKKLLKKVRSMDRERKSNANKQHDFTKKEDSLIEEANSLIDKLVEEGIMSKDSLESAISEAITDVLAFSAHEPDHTYHFNDEEKNMISQEMRKEIKKSSVDISDQEFEELLSRVLFQAQTIISKLRTPKF